MFNRKADLIIFDSDTSIDVSGSIPKHDFQRLNFSATKFARISKKLTSIHSISIYAQREYTGLLFDNVFVENVTELVLNLNLFLPISSRAATFNV